MKHSKIMLIGMVYSLLILSGCSNNATGEKLDSEQIDENSGAVDETPAYSEKEEDERLSDIVVPNFSTDDEELELELQNPLLSEDTVEWSGEEKKKWVEGEELEKKVDELMKERLGGREVEELEKLELGGDEYYLINEDINAEQIEFSMLSPKGIIMEIDNIQKLEDSLRDGLLKGYIKEDGNDEEKEDYNLEKGESQHFLKNTLYYMKDYVSDDLVNSGINRLKQIYLKQENISDIKFQLILNNLKSSIELLDTYNDVIRQNFSATSIIGANWEALKNEIENQKDLINSIDSYDDLMKHGDNIDSTELTEYGYAFIYGVEQFIGYNYKPIVEEYTE